ncbi:hypothetical protein [Pseudomonas poae]|uniref:DUF4234 domain-containing protein n=1 Tax=Pseudomonas poae TaxID=200451 RepID=A0A2S9EGK1_9PSED|nr:hypothetical protein [Pseudomonas poae]PRA30165.1 hypothetical protein CQZ97_10225 [Pseudomonas poae]PRC14302.1 hypothetical protein CQZ99_19620 [Pseudomonas poae]
MSAENPYAPPQANLDLPVKHQPTFFVVAPRKLLLMVLLSQGFYFVYWSYKHWANYRQATGARIWPWARGLFGVFFYYSLAMKARQKLHEKDSSFAWWPRCLALALVVSALLPQACNVFFEPLMALKINSCLLIVDAALVIQIQRAFNHLENDAQGDANCRITWANGFWMMLGVSLFVLTLLFALQPPEWYRL